MDQLLGRTIEQIAQPPDISQPRARIGPGRFEQDMVGFVFPQHVIDQVGREGDLLAGLALARMLPLDQAADHGDLAKGAPQQMRILHPFDEFILQDVGRQ